MSKRMTKDEVKQALKDTLAAIPARHTPGPWHYENVEQRDDRSAYGAVKTEDGKVLFDTLNSEVALIRTEADEGIATREDEVGRANLLLAAKSPELLDQLIGVCDLVHLQLIAATSQPSSPSADPMDLVKKLRARLQAMEEVVNEALGIDSV